MSLVLRMGFCSSEDLKRKCNFSELFRYTNMKKLTISQEKFESMLSGLIASGVTFEAEEDGDGKIVIVFTGGF